MMKSSDDETETMLAVSNYVFVDQQKCPISFSELPVRWNDEERVDVQHKKIFLYGSADGGLLTIYKQVLEWKFTISDAMPEILVLSKEKCWILLQKPRKTYEGIIRTILITVHCLYLMKNDHDLSRKSLWAQLSRVFSSYDPRPSENDLVDHIALIGEAVRRDKTLSESAFLIKFLEEKPQKKDFWNMPRPGFIVDDHIEVNSEEKFDEKDMLFDSVCAICDNGGELLCCEGRCMRSFHATENAGSESACWTLGYSLDRLKAMQTFLCGNCQYKQHQCFACGELGSSVKSAGAEVFLCVSATCGHFYHPHCVAKLLHHCNATEAEKLEKKIAAGESFTCPIHKCYTCKQGENKNDFDLQFAVCRRCPKSYHRKCMPREINFEGQGNGRLMLRAWDNLIPKRILIYCLDHEIDEMLGTPIRNHLKIPGDWQKKKKYASEQLMRKDRIVPKDSNVVAEVSPRKSSLEKLYKQTGRSSSILNSGFSRSANTVSSLAISNKKKVCDLSKIPQKTNTLLKVNTASMDGHGISLGNKLHAMFTKSAKGVRIGKEEMLDRKGKHTMSNELPTKVKSNMLSLDADSQRRILALTTDAASMITMKDITANRKLPRIYSNSSKIAIDKEITLGKVEASIKAIREALQKLDSGCSVEDAKAVCEPQLLHQIFKWKNKLKVYLAPFMYGMRYTSFGRHFTKLEKLKEIVNIVHCYVQEGDMIVDFCCGANDFSCCMKNKMDKTGKKCFYKNYDIIQAKHDFNFEKRDWMDVHPQELLEGSKLIMGLNPPFGVKASLANKFINKALEFKPKLLILIVPPETERLDRKYSPYDLVWEYSMFLDGKSFYFPGSIDVNDNQIEDWNLIPPPLYLWSRPDWTTTNRKIAEQNGHLTWPPRGKYQNIEIQNEINRWECTGNWRKKKRKRNEGNDGVQHGNQFLGKRKREEQYDDPFSYEMRVQRPGNGPIREMVEEGKFVHSTNVDEKLKDYSSEEGEFLPSTNIVETPKNYLLEEGEFLPSVEMPESYSSKSLRDDDDIIEKKSCFLMDNLYGHIGEGSTLKLNSDQFLNSGQLDKTLRSQCSTSNSYFAGTVPEFELPLPPPAYLQDFNHLNSSSYYGSKRNMMSMTMMQQYAAPPRFEMTNLIRSQMFPPPVGRPRYHHHFYDHNNIALAPPLPPPPSSPPPPLPPPPPYEENFNSGINIEFDVPPPPGVPYENQRLGSNSFTFAPPFGSNSHLGFKNVNFVPLPTESESNPHVNTYKNTG